jgi:hypothetical protein
MNDDRDFFAPRPTQPTIYCQDVCRPGWVQPMPEPAAAPLYTPAQARADAEAAAQVDALDVAELLDDDGRLIDLDQRWTLA